MGILSKLTLVALLAQVAVGCCCITDLSRRPPDYGPDKDCDGLSDQKEALLGTDPLVTDTDGDGIVDSVEVYTFKTDPLNVESRPTAKQIKSHLDNGGHPSDVYYRESNNSPKATSQ